MKSMIKATLSMPPSVNQLYAGYVRRYKSKKYKEWETEEEEREMQTKQLSKYSLNGDEWLTASYQFYFPLYTKDKKIKEKDLSNYFKALEDFMGKHIQGFDDRQIKKYQNTEKIDSKRNDLAIKLRNNIK